METVFGGVRALGHFEKSFTFLPVVLLSSTLEAFTMAPVTQNGYIQHPMEISKLKRLIFLEATSSPTSRSANILVFSVFAFLIKKSAQEQSVLYATVNSCYLYTFTYVCVFLTLTL